MVTVDGRFDGCAEFAEVIAAEELEADADIHPDDVVALPYSSGTTGLPKGVMLTHRSLITSVAQQVPFISFIRFNESPASLSLSLSRRLSVARQNLAWLARRAGQGDSRVGQLDPPVSAAEEGTFVGPRLS